MPLAILEAQSVGVPYIGNNVGGINEVITDNYNGFLISDVKIDEITEIAKRIKSNPIFYRSNARFVIEKKYSLGNMIKDLESLYFTCVY